MCETKLISLGTVATKLKKFYLFYSLSKIAVKA